MQIEWLIQSLRYAESLYLYEIRPAPEMVAAEARLGQRGFRFVSQPPPHRHVGVGSVAHAGDRGAGPLGPAGAVGQMHRIDRERDCFGDPLDQ